MTDDTTAPSSFDIEQLAYLHEAMAQNMRQMHKNALDIQALLDGEFEMKTDRSHALAQVQHLDRHAQMLEDFSRVLQRCAEGFLKRELDMAELKKVCALQSTVSALFDAQSDPPLSDKGDLIFL